MTRYNMKYFRRGNVFNVGFHLIFVTKRRSPVLHKVENILRNKSGKAVGFNPWMKAIIISRRQFNEITYFCVNNKIKNVDME